MAGNPLGLGLDTPKSVDMRKSKAAKGMSSHVDTLAPNACVCARSPLARPLLAFFHRAFTTDQRRRKDWQISWAVNISKEALPEPAAGSYSRACCSQMPPSTARRPR